MGAGATPRVIVARDRQASQGTSQVEWVEGREGRAQGPESCDPAMVQEALAGKGCIVAAAQWPGLLVRATITSLYFPSTSQPPES